MSKKRHQRSHYDTEMPCENPTRSSSSSQGRRAVLLMNLHLQNCGEMVCLNHAACYGSLERLRHHGRALQDLLVSHADTREPSLSFFTIQSQSPLH